MSRLIFDIETDGLLDQLTTIHSLVIKDADNGQMYSCCDDPSYRHETGTCTSALTIKQGLDVLMEADEIIGHNIVAFDIPAIQKVFPWFEPRGKTLDTLTMSRLIWSDIKENDFQRRARLKRKHGEGHANSASPKRLIGSHGLEAWGYRLGSWKGDYSKEREQALKAEFARRRRVAVIGVIREYIATMKAFGEKRTKAGMNRALAMVDLPPKAPTKAEIVEHVWGSWNPDMQAYCEQDVEVTHDFLKLIESKRYSQTAMQLETDFKAIIHRMEGEGFPFDKTKAHALEHKLVRRKVEIEQEMAEAFPPWEIHTPFVPKANNSTLGYVKGEVAYRTKRMVFNPASRDHIADRLTDKYGWEPVELTETGKPKVDETILKRLPYPEAKALAEYFVIGKRLGALSEGKNSWLGLVHEDSRIYHSVITNGAVTGRCTHKQPNLGQVPSVKAAYGTECRSLFHAPKGMVMVGADLSGLELRCLAHYMAIWDDGAYIKELLEGDIHTANQNAAGLPSRDNAKTFIYGFLYGAGDEKIGSIVGKGSAEGKRLKKQFLDKTPALKKLREAVQAKTAETLWVKGKKKPNPKFVGHLVGLDGRELPIRSSHAALNTLLQSAGALLAKKATVILYEDLSTRGWVFGEDYALMAHVHDEIQMWAKPELAEQLGEAAVKSFEAAGEFFQFRCPITGEYKVGNNWAETH